MSFFQRQESILEIKQRLMCSNVELESAKSEAREEQRKTGETITQLIHLLKRVCQERDEARDQLLKFQNKILPSIPVTSASVLANIQLAALTPQAENESSMPVASNTSFFPYHHDHSSSFFGDDCYSNAISPSDFPNSHRIDDSNSVISTQALSSQISTSKAVLQKQDCAQRTTYSPMQVFSSKMSSLDPASTRIEELIKGKHLPQKGQLLDAVIAAGPLLQMLLVAGPPLPQWKNCPPLYMPPELDQGPAIHKRAANKNNVGILNSLSSCPLHRLNFS